MLGGGGVSLQGGIGGGGPSWELGDAAWELCFRLGGGPLDGILLAGAALLGVCWRRGLLLAFLAARDPSEGESLDLLRHGAAFGDSDAGAGAVAAAGVTEKRFIAGARAAGVADRAAAEAAALPEAAAVAAAGAAGAAALEAGAAPDVGDVAAAAEQSTAGSPFSII